MLRVTYRLAVGEADARARADAIALEQTVEVPRVAVRDPFVAESIVGRVASIDAVDERVTDVAIDYPPDTTAHDPAQLLNVVFGMTSLQADAECIDIAFPESLLAALGGPRFGIAGLRERVEAPKRPMTATAVKPMGLAPEALASMLDTFGRSGIDLIKDDQGLADHPFCPFETRVRACLAAERAVADATGERPLYVPNLIGSPGRVFDQLRLAEDLGARAVMVSPMLLGLPTFWELCQQRASVPVIAHPSFGGAQRFAAPLLFGSLLRAYGADAVIFVSYGGRYGTPRPDCRSIADRLRADWGGLRASLPIPGGGIALEGVEEALAFYGSDVMLLVGGSLQIEPDGLGPRSAAFADAVRGFGG